MFLTADILQVQQIRESCARPLLLPSLLFHTIHTSSTPVFTFLLCLPLFDYFFRSVLYSLSRSAVSSGSSAVIVPTSSFRSGVENNCNRGGTLAPVQVVMPRLYGGAGGVRPVSDPTEVIKGKDGCGADF